MNKLNIRNIVVALSVVTTAISCDNQGYDDYNPGGTPTQQLNGEWFIDISDAEGNVLAQHTLHKTFDTNEGNGTMYLSDRIGEGPDDFAGYYLESKVQTDIANFTFSANDVENAADASRVTITNGKILRGQGHSATGVVTDSIYFEGEFDYDPGNKIIFAGHRRTGFAEDEF